MSIYRSRSWANSCLLICHYLVKWPEPQERGRTQDRLLKFDFIQRTMTNWKKNELRKSYGFEELSRVLPDPNMPLQLSIYAGNKPYAGRRVVSPLECDSVD
jgi:hypothetical protein